MNSSLWVDGFSSTTIDAPLPLRGIPPKNIYVFLGFPSNSVAALNDALGPVLTTYFLGDMTRGALRIPTVSKRVFTDCGTFSP